MLKAKEAVFTDKIYQRAISMKLISIMFLMIITSPGIALGIYDTRTAEFAMANEQLNKVYKNILDLQLSLYYLYILAISILLYKIRSFNYGYYEKLLQVALK